MVYLWYRKKKYYSLINFSLSFWIGIFSVQTVRNYNREIYKTENT